MKAYAWQSGLIEFGQRVPSEAMLICEGRAKEVKHHVACLARIGYDGGLLVPGVPENDSENAKLDALIAFSFRIQERMEKDRLTADQKLMSQTGDI
jgi:hypothetical protein